MFICQEAYFLNYVLYFGAVEKLKHDQFSIYILCSYKQYHKLVLSMKRYCEKNKQTTLSFYTILYSSKINKLSLYVTMHINQLLVQLPI